MELTGADTWGHTRLARLLERKTTGVELNTELKDCFANQPRATNVETVGKDEDVSGVHTLLKGVVQVCHELLVGEEKEKEEEQGRQEEREAEREGQSEETAHMDDCVDGVKVQDSNLHQCEYG